MLSSIPYIPGSLLIEKRRCAPPRPTTTGAHQKSRPTGPVSIHHSTPHNHKRRRRPSRPGPRTARPGAHPGCIRRPPDTPGAADTPRRSPPDRAVGGRTAQRVGMYSAAHAQSFHGSSPFFTQVGSSTQAGSWARTAAQAHAARTRRSVIGRVLFWSAVYRSAVPPR